MSTSPADRRLGPLILAAMGSAALVTALQVATRATRDTLYLTNFPVTTLPVMIAGGAVLSIVVALAAARAVAARGPQRIVPIAFLASAALSLGEWALATRDPAAGAILVYAHAAALGPVLLSGFWALLGEQLDPRSARGAIGRIAAAGTLGGLAGGILAERLADGFGILAPLPALALVKLVCAWTTSRLRGGGTSTGAVAPPRGDEILPAREAFRRLRATPYLSNLALLVLGSSLAAALLDYLFKAQVTSAARAAPDLMRVFAGFYSLVAVATFALQSLASRRALERVGIAPTIGTLPGAVLVGGAVAAFAAGPWFVAVVRGLEAVLRGSLFRAGFELLYTPIPPAEKRSTRIVIDVACDRLGDLGGAALLAIVLFVAPGAATPILFALAVLLAAATLGVVIRVQRGYVASLEAGLKAGWIDLDAGEIGDRTTLLTMRRVRVEPGKTRPPSAGPAPAAPPTTPAPDVREASGVREMIQLLGNDAWARGAVRALTEVAAANVDALVAALVDPTTDFPVRRRLPAVLAACADPRAAAGLTRGLCDARFEVRYRCGRALARLHEGHPALAVDAAAVLAAVCREAELGRPVWESRRLLDKLDETGEDTFVDEFLRDRAGRSLEHAFTLLALVLPRAPLKIAFRGLFADDRLLRGTSLEYLDAVLPPAVRAVLWPHLDPAAARPGAARPAARDREQVLAELLEADRSIGINLAELRRERAEPGSAPPD